MSSTFLPRSNPWAPCVTLVEITMNVKALYKAVVLIVVIGPLLATVFAISLLWQRTVHLEDIDLLLFMYTLAGIGVTSRCST